MIDVGCSIDNGVVVIPMMQHNCVGGERFKKIVGNKKKSNEGFVGFPVRISVFVAMYSRHSHVRTCSVT